MYFGLNEKISHLIFFQDKCLDWFPRLRAISLAVEDVDGEQNEWKTLQGQGRDLDDTHLLLFVIIVIVYYYLSLFTAGPDPEARPAVVLAAGRLEGPDDGAEETQAETRSVLTVRNVFLTVFTLPGLLNSAPSLINIGERH